MQWNFKVAFVLLNIKCNNRSLSGHVKSLFQNSLVCSLYFNTESYKHKHHTSWYVYGNKRGINTCSSNLANK